MSIPTEFLSHLLVFGLGVAITLLINNYLVKVSIYDFDAENNYLHLTCLIF